MSGHVHQHAFMNFHARAREGLTLSSRRNFVKASMAGLAGLSLPRLLQARAEQPHQTPKKSVILLWMAGGPSHIDMWDMKPDRPDDNRGPFRPRQTSVPGIQICEHLPLQAAMQDKITILRSVDARGSNHAPNMIFQKGNAAANENNREASLAPAMASVVAKYHGPNHPAMAANIAFGPTPSHLAFSGSLGRQFDPFMGNQACRLPVYDLVGNNTGQTTNANLFSLPPGLTHDIIHERRRLMQGFDNLRSTIDSTGNVDAMDRYQQQAVDLLLGARARDAFDITKEPQTTRDRYTSHLWCQQALLARRLVEAGAAFVTIDLSYHTASGTWDTHGDNIPPYGGIKRGLGPLLPLFDHLYTTLVGDLDQRGMLDDVLVLAMGEFGRTPKLGTQDSTDGRNHWPVVMSMLMAGGGFQHGQVIGSTERDGGTIKTRPVTPGDLAATIYHMMGVPQTYVDLTGRPRNLVESGELIQELT